MVNADPVARPRGPSTGADLLAAAVVGFMALVLYVRTLLPGLGGPEDTPKFQFLGFVLGTAHPPGYPLYTVLTHLFSYVPIGTLAYRMNLFSALCASVAVACAWLIARELGSSRIASAAAALGLACGQYFWWNAILAEVYALGAALLAAALWSLLRWSTTRRPLHLHFAAASIALALGNHLTVIAVVPALALYALLVDARAALRLRTLGVSLMILAAGWLQYGYILIRTAQGGPFLESSAHNLAELLAIIRAERFASDIGGMGWRTFFFERVPFVVQHLGHELGWYGAALVSAGLLILCRRRWPQAVLLGSGALGALALAAWVVADIKGFLLPVVVLAWPAAAPALDVLRRWLIRAAGRAGAVAALAAAAALPVNLVWSNFAHNDFSGETFYARYFDALFASLPPRTVFVREHYTLDRMLEYQLIVDDRRTLLRGTIPPEPVEVERMLQEGSPVYAFRHGAGVLAASGYRVEPVSVDEGPLGAALDALPRDSVVLLAASQRGLPVDLAPSGSARGRAAWWSAAQGRDHHAGITRARGREEAIVESRPEPFERAFSGSVEGIGPLPRDVRLVAGDRAAIVVHGREIVAAEPGLAVAALDSAGSVLDAWAFPPGAAMRVPVDMGREPLYRIAGRAACEQLGDRVWRDISPLAATGALIATFDNPGPAVAELLLYVTARHTLGPSVRALFDTPDPQLDMAAFDLTTAEGREALSAAAAADGAAAPATTGAAFAARIRVTVDGTAQHAVSALSFGGLPLEVLARGRADRVAARRVAACAEVLPPVLGTWVPDAGELPLGSATPYLGAGWSPPEHADVHPRPFRWTSALRAYALVPLDEVTPLRVTLRVLPASGVTEVAAEVNGCGLPPRALEGGWQEVEWLVPAAMLRHGVNVMAVVSDAVYDPVPGERDPRPRALLVERVRLRRGER
jgi:hypothetical protein